MAEKTENEKPAEKTENEKPAEKNIRKDDNFVYIGKKPAMRYVLASSVPNRMI